MVSWIYRICQGLPNPELLSPASLKVKGNKQYCVSTDSFPVAQMVKNLPAVQETQVGSLGWKDPLEKGMATHSSILAWRTAWTEKPAGLQSMGSQRLEHS